MNKNTPPWHKSMVGYVDTTAIGAVAQINEQQAQKYNVIIFGFTEADGTLSPQTLSGINSIRALQAANTINLISVGGQAGTLTLDDATVNNLANTVANNSFDGVDLDLEDGSIDIDTLHTFVIKLREKLGDQHYITTAPILAGSAEHPTLNIPTGASMEPIYSNVAFDAIFVQAYNSGTSFAYPRPSDPTQQVNEASPNIIAAAYDALQKNGNICKETAIIIGIPANPGGAPTESNLWNEMPLDQVVAAIKTNLADIEAGKYGIDNSQFGGLMAWSLNSDAMPSAYPPSDGATPNGAAGYFANNVADLI